MIFGKRLKGLMKERGITNAELADVVGVSEKLVERWCEGLSEPRIDKFVFIVKLFGVRMDYMLGEVYDYDWCNNRAINPFFVWRKFLKKYNCFWWKKLKLMSSLLWPFVLLWRWLFFLTSCENIWLAKTHMIFWKVLFQSRVDTKTQARLGACFQMQRCGWLWFQSYFWLHFLF